MRVGSVEILATEAPPPRACPPTVVSRCFAQTAGIDTWAGQALFLSYVPATRPRARSAVLQLTAEALPGPVFPVTSGRGAVKSDLGTCGIGPSETGVTRKLHHRQVVPSP